MNRRSENQPAEMHMTYASVSARVPSVIHANIMWRVFSFDTKVQNLYRTGCWEKCLSRPPAMCRQEWQDSVYAQSITTLPTRMMLPSPKPNPLGLWNARIASQVLISEMTPAA